ncbi:MAG: tetratricopeptide repeat protein [Sedimentisphaerales bacterium]
MIKRIMPVLLHPAFSVLLIGLFASCATICLAEEEALYQARVNVCSLIDTGKYTEAGSAADKLVADFSGNRGLPEAQYWIAERYERYDKFDEANHFYQQVIQNYSDSLWADKSKLGISRAKAKSLIVSQNYDQAQKEIDKLAVDFADNNDLPEAIFWITERFQRSGRLEDAKLNFLRIIDTYPSSPWAGKAKLWLSKITVLSLISAQQFSQAEDAIGKFVADFTENPDLPEALFWISEGFQRIDKFEEAKQNFQRVVDNYPASPWAGKAKFWLSRVTVFSLIVSQDYGGAKSALDKFMADYAGDTDYPETLYWIAERYERLGRFDEANSVYTQLSQKFPSNPWTDKAKLGVSRANVMALIVSEKYDQAKDALNKLITDFSSNPRLPGTLYWIAERYQRQNRFEEANRLYKQISANYPSNPYAQKAQFDIRVTSIHILLDANEVNKAEALTDKCIADFKDDSRLHEAIYRIGEKHYDLAFRLENQGIDEQSKEYYKRALSVWDKIITKMPSSDIYTPQAYYAVADCYYRLGDYNDAINYHKKVIADFPNFENRYMAMFMLADCYNKQASSGQIPNENAKELTINIYQELVNQYPDCQVANIARTQLFRLGAELP